MPILNPFVRVFHDSDSLSIAAAHIFIEQAGQSIRVRNRFLVALSGGSTPQHLFGLMAKEYAHNMDWEKVHVFWDDERCVPADNDESNYGQAWHIWLSHINIPEANVHPINGELIPEEAAAEYAHLLEQFASPPLNWPRFDLVYLGLGDDGHIASLFPGSPLNISQPAIAVSAHYENRPTERVTMTEPVLNSARMLVFMATGEMKAEIVGNVLMGLYDPVKVPAQRIDPKDGKVIWLLDELAASHVQH